MPNPINKKIFLVVHDDRGIANAKTFKAEMEAKTAKHKKIKQEIFESESPEQKPSSSSFKFENLQFCETEGASQALTEYSNAKNRFEKECQKWHSLIVATSKRMFKANSGPLGAVRIIPEYDKSDAVSIANYFVLVEKLCDEYFDCNAVHTISPCSEYSHSTDISASRALSEPRDISARTKIDWSGRFFITSFAFKRIWCRIVGLYMDWTSHIPELRELTIADQIRLVIDRCVPCIDILLGYRKIVRKANNFYREILAQQIKTQLNTSSMDQILNRMGDVMKFLSVIETAKNLEDDGFSVMTLFNIADMQGELPYEIHIRKGFNS
uniref:Uncharacterized protein n=1 Tax=Panagrolaimus sp. ES5 TaxID=591445 RepID=A0AC34FPP2_9BILA